PSVVQVIHVPCASVVTVRASPSGSVSSTTSPVGVGSGARARPRRSGSCHRLLTLGTTCCALAAVVTVHVSSRPPGPRCPGPCDAVCPAPIVHGSHEGASRRRLPACVGAAHRTLLTVEPRARLSAQVTRYPSPPPSRRPPALPPAVGRALRRAASVERPPSTGSVQRSHGTGFTAPACPPGAACRAGGDRCAVAGRAEPQPRAQQRRALHERERTELFESGPQRGHRVGQQIPDLLLQHRLRLVELPRPHHRGDQELLVLAVARRGDDPLHHGIDPLPRQRQEAERNAASARSRVTSPAADSTGMVSRLARIMPGCPRVALYRASTA